MWLNKNMKSTSIISSFWYKRICEITLLLSAIVIGLYGAATTLAQDTAVVGDHMLIPPIAAILAGITLVVSLIGLLAPIPQKFIYPMALLSYILLGSTAAYLIINSGAINSPFIAFWMLLAVFSGMFGLLGITLAALAVNGYLILEALLGTMPGKDQLITIALAGELPIVISYLIWHTRRTHDQEKNQAFSAMAAELSQVSGKADIVINSIADGVIAIDAASKIQLINPAALAVLGWKHEDAVSLDYHLVLKLHDIDGNELTHDADPVQKVLTTNESLVNDNITLKTASDKQIIVSLMVSPAGKTGGGGSGAIIVFRDITKQKMEEREQAEFISTASHEMRTPVASIEGYLGLALNPQTATIDDKAHSYLTKAHESAQHLGRLFQDLLDVTKADDGRMGNNPKVIDAVTFSGDIVASFEARAKEKGLILYFKPGTTPEATLEANKKISPVFYLNSDPDHLREVLSNLVENAIKYTKQGDVVVDVSGSDQKVVFSIQDSGIGIPQEDIGHLFQKFYRIDSSDTREIGGTGLGLYLCRRLVEAMNGRIWVESELNKGSTFFVELDRISHEDAMAMIEEAAAAPPVISRQVAAPVAASVAPDPTPAPQVPVAPQPAPAMTPPTAAMPQPPQAPPAPAMVVPQVPVAPAPQPVQVPNTPQPVVVAAPISATPQPASTPVATAPTQPAPQPAQTTNQQNVA